MEFFINSGLITGLLVILILFFYPGINKFNNRLLGVSIFCIWYSLFISDLNVSGRILLFPYFIRTGNITGYLIFPFFYLYVRNTFYPGIKVRPRDWWVLAPAIFYTIDMLPFFVADSEYKIKVMTQNLANPALMIKGLEGWLAPVKFHFVFRYIWALLFFLLQWRLIFRNRNNNAGLEPTHFKVMYTFLIVLTVLYIPILFPGIFAVVFQLKWYSYIFLNFTLIISLLLLTAFLLISPKILYGFYPAVNIPNHSNNLPLKTNPPIKNDAPLKINQPILDDAPVKTNPPILNESFSGLDKPILNESLNTQAGSQKVLPTEMVLRMINTIEEFVDYKKPYKDARYSIHDLSKDLSIPVYQLSPIINRHYGTNFNSWINKYRVDYFLLMCNDEEKKNFTLEALAKEVGFTSRSTFTTAFKKEKGVSPGTFLKTTNS